jgi:hypothetical protein
LVAERSMERFLQAWSVVGKRQSKVNARLANVVIER